MGPRGFWIALAIVLFYLIARPHVGTVWYVNADSVNTPSPKAGSWLILSGVAASGHRQLRVRAHRQLPRHSSSDRTDCLDAVNSYTSASGLSGAFCASKNALLWGW